MTDFTRTNLMKGYDSKPIYAYDAAGDFRHGITKVRIIKGRSGWDLKTLETGYILEDYMTGFQTKSEAVDFVNEKLA
ncbi:MAG: hypothetical protein RTU92_08625 [Candidatus Thorarchaeota archaeon]